MPAAVRSSAWTRRKWLVHGVRSGWVVLGGTAVLRSLGGDPAAYASEPASRTAAVARWPVEWRVDHFTFHADYDFGEERQQLAALRELQGDLAEALGIRISGEPIHVIMFAERHDYEQYLAHYFPSVPKRRALFIKRRGPGMVFTHQNPQMDVDLRHETTHALLNASLAYVPLWLDEGLAEYFEAPAEQRLENNEHLRSVSWRARLRQIPRLETLEQIDSLAEMGPNHYRDAWSWVHFLLHESGQTRGILQRFLSDIQSGLPPGPLSRRVRAGVSDVEGRYLRHFR